MEQSKISQAEKASDKAVSSLERQIAMECVAMASYAFRSGLKVPVSVMQTLDNLKQDKSSMDGDSEKAMKDLVSAHVKLSKLIAPATPRTIIFLGEGTMNDGILKFHSSARIIRKIGFTAAFFLISFILLSLSPLVTSDSVAGDPLMSSGLNLLLNEFFILAAAGVGATFAALFEANKYLVSYTFDPKYSYSYWIKIGLGIISGFILAEMIPLDQQASTMSILGKPTLAMLGGFSATVVYRILKRLVKSVESIFEGDVDQQIEAKEAAAEIQNQEKLSQMRFSHTSNLLKLRKELIDESDSEKVQQILDKLLEEMMPGDKDID